MSFKRSKTKTGHELGFCLNLCNLGCGSPSPNLKGPYGLPRGMKSEAVDWWENGVERSAIALVRRLSTSAQTP